MRGKKALGLICGWPSRGGRKEMTSDMAQVTKQGSEVNIKCLQSTKCEISSSFPVYSAVLFFFLKIPEQENVNYQKVFLLIIFKLHFRVLVLCSKNQPEIILLSWGCKIWLSPWQNILKVKAAQSSLVHFSLAGERKLCRSFFKSRKSSFWIEFPANPTKSAKASKIFSICLFCYRTQINPHLPFNLPYQPQYWRKILFI